MRLSLDWMTRILGGERRDVLALLTPDNVRARGPLVRLLVAGGTVAGLVAASLVGLVALAALLFAIAAIYFLATQVLGLKVSVDPQALYQQVQRQAASYGVN